MQKEEEEEEEEKKKKEWLAADHLSSYLPCGTWL